MALLRFGINLKEQDLQAIVQNKDTQDFNKKTLTNGCNYTTRISRGMISNMGIINKYRNLIDKMILRSVESDDSYLKNVKKIHFSCSR
jgi:hypothetical protein